LAET